ncbi:MAG: ATP-dependent helicase HrpB [Actinobacteria bacterium]|nr:ATP-dependent helicase HrpB [Actinomycetota bacterium]
MTGAPGPTDLPVEEAIGAVVAALASRRSAVLVAPPGAGKTTLVPLRLLHQPWLAGRRIVVLEPRRLAARAAARRMADLLGEDVGGAVGYQTRDERRIGARTRIEVLTEGILTRRLQADPTLEGTGLVVFDEVHERNVPTDLGLAFLLDARRSLGLDVAILAMSATAQVDAFSRLLSDTEGASPVVSCEGRQFPVEVRHAPRRRNEPLEQAVASAVVTALRDDLGDVLVFLPGIGEIERARTVLESRLPRGVVVRRLAGGLPIGEQDDALRAADGRRVVLSTDIAETSLTVDGVSIVIDAGLARVPRFDARTGLTELTTVTSSRASADQRSGRAGRLGPGVAYRLWSRIEDSTRLAHLPAEITQVDLCPVALEIAVWGTPAGDLSLIDPPGAKALAAARATLTMLGLVDTNGAPTPLGVSVLALPVHPRLGTMLAHSAHDPVSAWLACVLAALLDERDIMRGRPTELPADIGLRAGLVLGHRHDDRADRAAARRVERAARDLARRLRISPVEISPDAIDHLAGPLLLGGFPDRLAKRRQSPGQFVVRSGGDARCDPKDALAGEEFVVAVDVDPRKGGALLRRAAAVDADSIALVLGDGVEVDTRLEWDKSRDDLVMRVIRRAGALRLDERIMGAPSGPDTTNGLLVRLRDTRLEMLGGLERAESLRARTAFLRHHLGGGWPDLSMKTLLATLDEWLAPHLVGATSRTDLERIDLAMVLESMLGWDASKRLRELAPVEFTPMRGRPVRVDYSNPDHPQVSLRVQSLFGTRVHPTVMDGAVRLRVQLLSPADRPIQVTSDLPGFWSGSWAEVRKEMAGRYPKHDWPVNPGA